jgi:hypothetical protein|tara:strand:+ start:2289 stop:2522 length:234 start_codon:yes stop_codon:yes gene_type:complete
MKNVKEVIGKLIVERKLPYSPNGNPRYLVTIDGQEYRTIPDGSLSYGITEYDGLMVRAVVGTHYNQYSVEQVNQYLV